MKISTQEKNLCSLVLKLKVFFSKYLQEHYTRCITRAALFFKNVPGTFFNATHQVKAIAIGVSKANPLVKSVDCCDVYIYTCSSHDSRKIDTKRNPPIPTFIWVPILQFPRTMGSLLTTKLFCLK